MITKQKIDEYVQGKRWYIYVPGWLFGLYVFVLLVRFNPSVSQPLVVAIPQSFDFFLHEMAHIVTGFLPAMVCASAGSLSEILLGTLLIGGALKERSYFALLYCCLWFMLACQSAGTYMADARAQKMSLVSLGGMLSGSGEAKHDWNFVFGKLHVLPFDTFIGYSVRIFGMLVGAIGLGFAGYLMYRMISAPSHRPTN